MNLKSILLTGAAMGLLSPSILSTVSSQPETVRAATTSNSVQTLNSIIPPVHSNYWREWRHVVLTQPMTVNLMQWYKNSLGGWDAKVAKTYQLDAGTSVYMSGYTKTFTIMQDQPKSANIYTGHQTVLHAHIDGTPNVKLIDDQSNAKVSQLHYQQAAVKRFNNKKWHTGVYTDDDQQPVLLFSTFDQVKRYDDLAEKMGDIGDATDDGTQGLGKKYINYIKRTTKQFKAIKKVATKFNNPKQTVKVKLTKDDFQMVKLNGKTYYSEGGASSSISPYNIQNGAGTIQSQFDPNTNHQFMIAQKDNPLYLYKGEKWIGPHKWQYDGKKWVQNNHLTW